MPTDRRPLVILKPAPQSRDRIFTPEALRRLRDAFRVVDLEDDPNPHSFTAALGPVNGRRRQLGERAGDLDAVPSCSFSPFALRITTLERGTPSAVSLPAMASTALSKAGSWSSPATSTAPGHGLRKRIMGSRGR